MTAGDRRWNFDYDCSKRGVVIGEVECGCRSYDPYPLARCELHGLCVPVNFGSDRGWMKKSEEYEIKERPTACSTCRFGTEELFDRIRSENPNIYGNRQ